MLGQLWEEFGAEHASPVLSSVARLSKSPFLWHSVMQTLAHSSTWAGTGQGMRLLLGAVFLDENPETVLCDSHCEFCGNESSLQIFLKSISTAVFYPKSPPVKLPVGRISFATKFSEFFVFVLTAADSPYRDQASRAISQWRQDCRSNRAMCPIKSIPNVFGIFSDSTYFFSHLKRIFQNSSSGDSTPPAGKRQRTSVPSVASFIAVLSAKAFEASTVESGRNFDSIMLKFIASFVASLPVGEGLPVLKSRVGSGIEEPTMAAASLVQLVKNSLVTLFLPPTEWRVPGASLVGQLNSALKADRLERCNQFMEPSAVLSVIRHMMSATGVIPDLAGNNEGKFNFSISGIKVVKFDLDRSVCVLKSIKTSSPIGTPSTTASVTPSENLRGAKLALIVKEVNVQLEHEWRIDWNAKRYGSYFGKNVVSVKGLSSHVEVTIFPDDQGPVIDSARISLGIVEHSCSILNASFISEMLAQAALDWFAEPLTRLLQSASQTAIEQFLKSATLAFRLQVWNGVVLPLIPGEMLADLLASLNDHLPKQGIPI